MQSCLNWVDWERLLCYEELLSSHWYGWGLLHMRRTENSPWASLHRLNNNYRTLMVKTMIVQVCLAAQGTMLCPELLQPREQPGSIPESSNPEPRGANSPRPRHREAEEAPYSPPHIERHGVCTARKGLLAENVTNNGSTHGSIQNATGCSSVPGWRQLRTLCTRWLAQSYFLFALILFPPRFFAALFWLFV